MIDRAVVAKRTESEVPHTTEIRRLTEAAGAEVVGAVTQRRPADPGLELGPGKVEELAALVEETGADGVVVDNDLAPEQTVGLESATGVRVLDRHRVVLAIFAEQARTRRAQLQVELARLRYRLPRIRARSDEGALNRFTESGTPLYDVRDRIDELERKLSTALERVPDGAPVVTALNKRDRIDGATVERRTSGLTAAGLAPDPVPISAREDALDDLAAAVRGALPAPERATLRLPLSNDAMSLLSWLHDEAVEVDVEYDSEAAAVSFAARSSVVEKARARAAALRTV